MGQWVVALVTLFALAELSGQALLEPPRCWTPLCEDTSPELTAGEHVYKIDEKRVLINLVPGKLSLECVDGDLNYAHLPRFERLVELKWLVVKECTAPAGGSYAELAARLRVNASGLWLRRPRAALAAGRLAGLARLEDLHLEDAELAAPAALAPLGALRSLRLRGGSLRLELVGPWLPPTLAALEVRNADFAAAPPGLLRGLRALRSLVLSGDRLRELPSDLFADCASLRVLDLSANPMASVPGLTGLPALETLALHWLPANATAPRLCSDCPRLREVSAWGWRRMRALPEGWLAALPALRKVSLRDCGLRALPRGLLAGSAALLGLEVRGCALETYAAEVTRDQLALADVDLSHNALGALPEDFCSTLPALRDLNLRGNRISELPSTAFVGCGELNTLSLESNRIAVLPSGSFATLTALRALNVSANRVERVEPGAFPAAAAAPALAALDLSANPLRALCPLPDADSALRGLTALVTLRLARTGLAALCADWRSLMPRLELLDLSDCALTRLEARELTTAYGADRAPLTLDLRRNNVTGVRFSRADGDDWAAAGARAPAVARVLLAGNPLACDADAYWLLRAAAARDSAAPGGARALADAECAAPPRLRGRRARDVPLGELAGAAPAACPPRCACEYRPHAAELRVACAAAPAARVAAERAPGAVRRVTLRLERLNLTELPPLPPLLVELHAAGNALAAPPAAPASLELLDLRDNRISAPPAAAARRLLAPGRRVLLAGNPLSCACDGEPLLTALAARPDLVADYEALRCADGRAVREVRAWALCARGSAPPPALALAALAPLALVAAVAAALYCKYRAAVKAFLRARALPALGALGAPAEEWGRAYDAFVSYAQGDAAFALEELVPRLERAGLRVCVHHRDWAPGVGIPAQIAASVAAARRTVLVVSEHFARSEWCAAELRAALGGAPRVVPVLLAAPAALAADAELAALLASHTYLLRDDPRFWARLLRAMPRARRPAKERAAA